jgi:hypothetical protein
MTELIDVHTPTLNGAALDWAVAQVEGVEVAIAEPHYGTDWRVYQPESGGKYSPSTDWAVTGPLLDKYHVSLIYAFEEYEALIGMAGSGYHSSATVAVCRAIVAAAALGDTVQVPKELMP